MQYSTFVYTRQPTLKKLYNTVRHMRIERVTGMKIIKRGTTPRNFFPGEREKTFLLKAPPPPFPLILSSRRFSSPLFFLGVGGWGREMKSKIVLKVGETEINPSFKEEKSRGPPIRGAQIPASLLPAYLHLFLLLLEKYFWQRGDREE